MNFLTAKPVLQPKLQKFSIALVSEPALQAGGRDGKLAWCMVCEAYLQMVPYTLIIPGAVFGKRSKLFRAGHYLIVQGECDEQHRVIRGA